MCVSVYVRKFTLKWKKSQEYTSQKLTHIRIPKNENNFECSSLIMHWAVNHWMTEENMILKKWIALYHR